MELDNDYEHDNYINKNDSKGNDLVMNINNIQDILHTPSHSHIPISLRIKISISIQETMVMNEIKKLMNI